MGYDTGIGLRGSLVASKSMKLIEAQNLIDSLKRKWGRTVTTKIPNLGMVVEEPYKEEVEDWIYAAGDRRLLQHPSKGF